MFSNAVCIQYEEEEDEIEDDEEVLRVKVRVNNIHLNSLSHIIFPTTFPLTSTYRSVTASFETAGGFEASLPVKPKIRSFESTVQ